MHRVSNVTKCCCDRDELQEDRRLGWKNHSAILAMKTRFSQNPGENI